MTEMEQTNAKFAHRRAEHQLIALFRMLNWLTRCAKPSKL